MALHLGHAFRIQVSLDTHCLHETEEHGGLWVGFARFTKRVFEKVPICSYTAARKQLLAGVPEPRCWSGEPLHCVPIDCWRKCASKSSAFCLVPNQWALPHRLPNNPLILP